MRWSASGLAIVAACSTAPLDQPHVTVGTFDSASASGDTSGASASVTDADTSTTKDPSDPSDPTILPESSSGASDPSGDTGSTGSAGSSGGESSSAGSSSSGVMESGPMETTTGPDPLACIDGDLGGALGDAVASGTIAGATDDLTISCAGGGGADAVYLWTAPAAGTYTFDLSGSQYDTGMALFDPDCSGAEMVCNDDALGLTSQITSDFAAGESVLVAVDGYNGATGSFVLGINAGSAPSYACADGGDLGSATGSVASGSTAGAVDDWAASCAADGPDIVYTWTAPSAAMYTFSLAGSSYDTLLTLQSPDCGGSELACNDDFGGLQSQLSANIAAGETVLVVVDGYNTNSGSYTLAID
jgi:hypothetical protein